jgi:BarA-like signal transduction histidine kinase
VPDAVSLSVIESDGLSVTFPESVSLEPAVSETVLLAVSVAARIGDCEAVWVATGLGVHDAVLLGVTEALGVGLGVGVQAGEAVAIVTCRSGPVMLTKPAVYGRFVLRVPTDVVDP